MKSPFQKKSPAELSGPLSLLASGHHDGIFALAIVLFPMNPGAVMLALGYLLYFNRATQKTTIWPNYNISPTAVCSETPGQLLCPRELNIITDCAVMKLTKREMAAVARHWKLATKAQLRGSSPN